MTHTIPQPFHHPHTDLLSEYVCGHSSEAMNLLISTHLFFCRTCRRLINGLEELAGTLLISASSEPLSKNMLDICVAKIQKLASIPTPSPNILQRAVDQQNIACHDPTLPDHLKKLLPAEMDQLPWKFFLGKNIKEYKLGKSDGWRWGLVSTKAGEKLPYHSHRGIEATLILKGNFSDANGFYKVGDFVVCDQETTHQPLMGKEDDCLCLYAMNAPIQFKGPFLRLTNPFLRI